MTKQTVGENKEAAAGDKNTPAAATEPPYIIHRSRAGLKLIKSFQGNELCKTSTELANTEGTSNRVESVYCSEDGQYVAWLDNDVVRCSRLSTSELVFEQPNTHKSNSIYISPKSTKLMTYSTMSGGDNLHFWDLNSQQHVASIPHKKASQWKPVFSMSEDICFIHANSELILYVGGKFDKPKQRISHIKISDFSLSTASLHNTTYQHLYERRIKNKIHHISVYTPGVKGQPSIVKIYKYPNMTDCVANKSFYKADRVKFSWSPSGNSLLLTCLADFDKTGKSYYGEQSLNYLNVKGESYFVKLPKEGTISHIEWYPSCDEDMFVCVYGLVPAQVSLFNSKCEVLFSFTSEGQGSFNSACFSPFGNLLAVSGFGNLAGQLCIWDFEKKKMISSQKVPETTGIEWCPNGTHLITCTTAPRLRVDNGFRIWHYSGSLVYEIIELNDDQGKSKEVYDVLWQPQPGRHKKPKCDAKQQVKTANLLSQSKLQKFQSSAGKYVPPSMRNKDAGIPGLADLKAKQQNSSSQPQPKGNQPPGKKKQHQNKPNQAKGDNITSKTKAS